MANYPTGTYFSGPVKLGLGSMLLSGDQGGIPATAKTLTYEESNGQHYILDSGTGVVITLPKATQGWKCRFTIGKLFTTDYVITAAATGTLEGSLIAAGAVVDCAAKDTLTIQDGVENLGDFYDFWSDGTSIFVTGYSLTGTSATPG